MEAVGILIVIIISVLPILVCEIISVAGHEL